MNQFIKRTNFLESIFARPSIPKGRVRPGDELHTLIQLVLSSQALRFEHAKVLSFDESQQAAYQSTAQQPLFAGFSGTDVNIEWALHMVNFFRYHMLREDEQTLHGAWEDLTEKDNGLGLPQLMKKQINNNDTAIGQQWLGTYGKSFRPWGPFIAN